MTSKQSKNKKILGSKHIFPCNDVGLSSSADVLQTACNTFIQMDKWEDYNAFPTYYPMGVRVGYDPSVILEKFNEQIKTHGFNNFFIYYGGGGIECCSTIPLCINEMFVQSQQGQLRFFPNWVMEKDASFENLRTYGAFLVSGSIRNGEVGKITLTSEKGRKCVVISPWREGLNVTCNDKLVPVMSIGTAHGTDYRFSTKPGMTYMISRGSRRV